MKIHLNSLCEYYLTHARLISRAILHPLPFSCVRPILASPTSTLQPRSTDAAPRSICALLEATSRISSLSRHPPQPRGSPHAPPSPPSLPSLQATEPLRRPHVHSTCPGHPSTTAAACRTSEGSRHLHTSSPHRSGTTARRRSEGGGDTWRRSHRQPSVPSHNAITWTRSLLHDTNSNEDPSGWRCTITPRG